MTCHHLSHPVHPLAMPHSLLNCLVSHLALACLTFLPFSLLLIKVPPTGLYTRSVLPPLLPSLASVGPWDVCALPTTLSHPLPSDKVDPPLCPLTPRPCSPHNTYMQILNLLALHLILHCPLLSLGLFNKSPHPLLSPTVPLASRILFSN